MTVTLLYDGGCPFCREFALRSELTGGIDNLEIRDARSDHALRQKLSQQGISIADGAVLLDGGQIWHGSDAVAELSRRMKASDPLLRLLRNVFKSDRRSRALYPVLLQMRRITLGLTGLPEDPDEPFKSA